MDRNVSKVLTVPERPRRGRDVCWWKVREVPGEGRSGLVLRNKQNVHRRFGVQGSLGARNGISKGTEVMPQPRGLSYF